MNTTRHLPLFFFALSTLAIACDNKDKAGDSSAGADRSAEAAKPAGPCGGASEGLSGIAILEVKDVPDDPEKGGKLVTKLRKELAEECVAKGYDKTATEALGCYEKNKEKAGYRVLKGCDDKIGRELIDAVVAKNGGKRPKE